MYLCKKIKRQVQHLSEYIFLNNSYTQKSWSQKYSSTLKCIYLWLQQDNNVLVIIN